MSIELSPPSTPSAKPAARTDAHAAKGKTTGTDAGSGGQAGFLAILGTLGEEAIPGAAPTVGAGDALVADPSTLLPADTSAFDANLLLQQNPQIAAAQAALNSVAGSEKSQTMPALGALQPAAMPVDVRALPADGTVTNADRSLPGAEGRARAGLLAGGTDAGAQIKAFAGNDEVESATQTLQHGGAQAKRARAMPSATPLRLPLLAPQPAPPRSAPK